MDPEILHADNHLLVVRKPAGVPTVPDSSGSPSLLEAAREWVRRTHGKPGRVFLGVVQRLDRPVSGVLVFARTSKAAARLTDALREGRVGKHYLGVAEGIPRLPDEEGTVEQWLVKDRERNRVHPARDGNPGARRAVTHWRLLGADPGRGEAVLAFRPETGRPHQLRLAAASLGTPLKGDLKYGARVALPDASVALHAHVLELDHPTRDERLRFVAAPPDAAVWELARSLLRRPGDGGPQRGAGEGRPSAPTP